ncbi:hypothetical protein BDR07DRAFT_1379902 [Suillus spraguei]|nr:hypothetical protein BDR07DRAFT_1379902 [Suillus spraguei]
MLCHFVCVCCCVFVNADVILCYHHWPFSFFITMVTSASFHGVVGLQNGSRYQIDEKNYWRYDSFIATLEMDDIHVNVFTFGANAASVEDSIYLWDARTTVVPIIDDDGKSAHSLHLFANDVKFHAVRSLSSKKMGLIWIYLNMLPLLNKICKSIASIPNLIHVSPKLLFPLPDIALRPSDMVTSVDDNSETVPSTTLKQFDWGGAHKEKCKAKGKGKEKKEAIGESGKRARDDDKDKDDDPPMSTAGSSKIACKSGVFVKIPYMQLKNVLSIVNQYNVQE